MIRTQSFICAALIDSGGAKRILSPWVGFANKPFSFKVMHKSKAE